MEWLPEATSTNDVVMGWLQAEMPEQMCLVVADVQTAGRGREGRTWTAPKDAALLCSIGFRPTWLEAGEEWKLAAIVSLAMAEAGEEVAGLTSGSIRLKWPNDLVVVDGSGVVRKLAGVLGETASAGTSDAKAVIGIGVNAGWRRLDFPPGLADSMTSLAELAGGVPIDRERLLDSFIHRLEPLEWSLRRNSGFPADSWRARQLTNGNLVRLEWPDGSSETVRAMDVDPATGALLVEPPDGTGPPRQIIVGEIRHLRVGVLAQGEV